MTGPTLPGVQGQQDDGATYVVPVDSSMVGESIPANTVPKEVDARNRAWRTFQQNVSYDILVVAAAILWDALNSSDFAFTWTFWGPVLVSILKTGVMVIVAYVMRLKSPPVGATE